MRQMKAGPSRPVPVVVKPPVCSSSYPVVGVVSQPRSTLPPNGPKSTATMAPWVGVHCATGSALAAPGTVKEATPVPSVRKDAVSRGRKRRLVPDCRFARSSVPTEAPRLCRAAECVSRGPRTACFAVGEAVTTAPQSATALFVLWLGPRHSGSPGTIRVHGCGSAPEFDRLPLVLSSYQPECNTDSADASRWHKSQWTGP